MSLTSPTFLAAAAVLTLLYYLLPRRCQWPLLLAVSLAFYLTGGLCAMAILAVVTGTTYLTGLGLGALNAQAKDRAAKEACRRKKKFLVLAACLANFGLLVLLKYGSGAVRLLGRCAPLPAWEPVMPLGLSFFIFQAVGYVVDVYRGKIGRAHV